MVKEAHGLFPGVCAAIIFWAMTGWTAEDVTHLKDVTRFEECTHFLWDLMDNPDVGLFRLYVSESSGIYRIDRKDPQKSKPDVIIPAIGGMVSQVVCSKLHLPRPGTWYAVLTAVTKDVKEESQPSNEISFTYGNQTPVDPVPPPGDDMAWRPPWSTEPYDVPAPLPGLPLVPPSPPEPPRPQSGDWLLSESCLWKGVPCPD